MSQFSLIGGNDLSAVDFALTDPAGPTPAPTPAPSPSVVTTAISTNGPSATTYVSVSGPVSDSTFATAPAQPSALVDNGLSTGASLARLAAMGTSGSAASPGGDSPSGPGPAVSPTIANGALPINPMGGPIGVTDSLGSGLALGPAGILPALPTGAPTGPAPVGGSTGNLPPPPAQGPTGPSGLTGPTGSQLPGGPITDDGSGLGSSGQAPITPPSYPIPIARSNPPGGVSGAPAIGKQPAMPPSVWGGSDTAILGSQSLGDLQQGFLQATLQNEVNSYLQQQSKYYVIDANQNVLVNLRFPAETDFTQMPQVLTSEFPMNVTLVTANQGLITGFVPVANLDQLNGVPGAIGASPVYAPQYSSGPVVDQGDHVMHTDTFRQKTGVTGAGVTVGVISDSVNQVTSSIGVVRGTGLDLSQKVGALPGHVTVLNDGTINPTDEGRGVLEVIHDVAPGAALAFATAEGGPQAMAQNIQALATKANAKVIVDDALYPDEPFFNDGVLAKTVDNTVITHDIVYLTAAGNNANNGWQDAFRPEDATVGGFSGTFANLDGNPKDGEVLQHFQLAVGQTLNLSFQWDAAFLEGGSLSPNYQVPNELDVLVTTADGQQLLHRFGDVNPMTGEALQRVVFTNDGTFGTNDFAMSFQLVSGPAPTELKWIRFDTGNAPAQFQGAPTIFGHAAALQAVTVGAVPWYNLKRPEAFTSQGKVKIYFDNVGKRLPGPVERYKPDVAGPDAVDNASFPAVPLGAPASVPVFTGTSAAAANLAAGAALLRAQSPNNNYWSVVLQMEHNAVPVESTSWSTTTGYGFDPPGNPASSIPLSTVNWTLIGPAPEVYGKFGVAAPVTSGRTVGIAADPSNGNNIYIAAAGGGVWHTSDGGQSWTPQTDKLSTLFMGAITMAPSDSNRIYAGTGEPNDSGDSFYGRGILVTKNGGLTWTLETNGGIFDRLTTYKIVVDPKNEDIVYAEMTDNAVNGAGVFVNGGVYKSTDGGATWTNTTSNISSTIGSEEFTDLVMDPNDDTKLYMAIGSTFASGVSNGIYKSTDSGGTWTLAGNTPTGINLGRISLGISKANSTTVYAAIADFNGNLLEIEKTTNGGTNWNAVTAPVNYMGGGGPQGFYDNAVAVDPSNASIVYVGGSFNGTNANGNFVNQVLRSADGGTTWTDYTIGADGNGVHPDHHALVFDANGKLLDANDGGIWRLDNAAANNITWTDLNANLSTLQFYGIGVHPTDPNIVYGGMQDNGTGKFTGALGWTQVRGGDGGFARVDFTNPNTVYHTYFFPISNFIERSDDGGATWTNISAGINLNDNGSQLVPYVLDPSNSSRVVLGTDSVYESTNKGGNWRIIGTPRTGNFNPFDHSLSAVAVAKSSPNTIYASTAFGEFFATFDDGANWVQRKIPNVTDNIAYLAVDPNNSQIVYAVRSGFGGGHVFQTKNGGQSWTDISGILPDLPTNAVTLVGGAVVIGNDTGVFVTLDGGANWSQVGAGMPNAQVVELVFNPTLNILSAATHGRSVWQLIPTFVTTGGAGNDIFDPNFTSDTAHDFGTLAVSASRFELQNIPLGNLPSGLQDYDWFKWTMDQGGAFTATMTTPIGGPLELHLFTVDNSNTLIQLAQDTSGNALAQVSTGVTAGEVVYVEIKGKNVALGVYATGTFTLDVQHTA